MQRIEKLVTRAGKIMDIVAGWGIVAVMALVVINVLMRVIFNNPIMGIYEYVGYLTAGIIAFSVSYCALQNAHIAISFIFEKLPLKSRKIIDIITGFIIVLFLLFLCVQVVVYALKVMSSGEVSPTAKMPFYPFIFMTALGLFVLSVIEFIKIMKGVRREWQQK
jgi:TRAP-type C4-dicarboxylate transport system permease small subunit